MGVELIIELADLQAANTVQVALESYQARLRASIERTRRRLAGFEARYAVSTDRFLSEMAAEDLPGGDLEYVEWAGEAKLLDGLMQELRELEDARVRLPYTTRDRDPGISADAAVSDRRDPFADEHVNSHRTRS